MNTVVPDENAIYRGVGRELRDVREAMALSLEDVAAALRIQLDYLEALEAGRYGDLPGAAYAVGFLRTYANYLGLDANRLVQEFKDEQAIALKPKPLNFPQPLEKSRRAPTGLIILLAAVTLVLYLVFAAREEIGETVEGIVPPVPERFADLLKNSDEEKERPKNTANATAEPVAKVAEKKAAAAAAPPATPAPPVTEKKMPASESAPRQVAETKLEEKPAADEAAAAQVPRAVIAETDPATARAEEEKQKQAAAEAAPPSEPETPLTATEEANERRNEEIDTAPTQSAIQTALKQTEDAAAVAEEEAPPVPAAPIVKETAPPPPAPPVAANTVTNKPEKSQAQTFGGANKDGRIVLVAREDSWIQVKSLTNELLITRVLRSGDRYMVPNREDLLLTTGNAGGLDIVVDGKTLPSLGKRGKVKRDIALVPAKLLAQ